MLKAVVMRNDIMPGTAKIDTHSQRAKKKTDMKEKIIKQEFKVVRFMGETESN